MGWLKMDDLLKAGLIVLIACTVASTVYLIVTGK